MSEAAKRELVVCDKCDGTGEIRLNPFKMIAGARPDECDKCQGDGRIRLPLVPPNATQDQK